jgi:predicted permease
MTDWFRQDVRHAVRALARRPGYTALLVLTLALGLGVNTVAFSIVNAILFRPARTPDAADIGWLFVRTGQALDGRASARTLDTLAAHASTLAHVGGEGRSPVSCDVDGALLNTWALVISDDYFGVVRPPLAAGRTLSPADSRAASGGDALPILISEAFWARHAGRTRDLSSIRIDVNGQPAAVMGVVRDDFPGPGGLFAPDLWVPLAAAPRLHLGPAFDRDAVTLTLLARPAPGASAAAVAADVRAIVLVDGRDAPDHLTTSYVRVRDGHPSIRGAVMTASVLATLAVAIVLGVACFNAAGLVLARTFERRRDMGVRAAMGAGRWRLIRGLLTEGALVAGVAGAVAMLLASWTSHFAGAFSLPAPIPQRLVITLDGRVVAFGALATALAAIVPAVAPAWRIVRTPPLTWIHAGAASAVGSRRDRRLQRRFMLAQTAASTVFLVLALLLVQSFRASASADLGFDTTNTALLELDPARDQQSTEARRRLADVLVERLGAASDIAGVALADRAPFFVGSDAERPISADGRDCRARPSSCRSAVMHAVTTSYFDTLAMPLRFGRVFDGHAAGDEVVVDETAAAAFWPGRSALGGRLFDGLDRRPRIVVGVVADSVHRAMGERRRPHVYEPLTPAAFARPVTVLVRGRSGAETAAARLTAVLHDLEPDIAAPVPERLADRLAMPLWPVRAGAAFVTTCAAVALLLVWLGLFGMTYYAVSQRRREFGVRLAVGATSVDLRTLVIGETLRVVAPGVAIGLVASVGAAAFLRGALYGVSVADWRFYVAAALAQAAVTVLASWSPARRAARTDPWRVLRAQ